MSKDWSHLFEQYRGKWVALADDEVTVRAAGATAKEAHRAALKHTSMPVLYRVPDTLEALTGYEI